MIDSDGRGILIDFGQCRAEGLPVTGHTPDFSNKCEVSKKENDYYALELCEKWLIEWKSKQSNKA
jgi:hypothetical protein